VLDRGSEGRTADGVDDEVELAVDALVAPRGGDVGTYERCELDGVAADAAASPGHEHPPAEQQTAELERAQRRQAGGRKGRRIGVRHAGRKDGEL